MPAQRREILALLDEFKRLEIGEQIDYQKFYLYSIITHSTAIEGSTVTEIENQLLFDEGISASGRSMMEQFMNLDLKAAYEQSLKYAQTQEPITKQLLCGLSAMVMKNTGAQYKTPVGDFDASRGDLRLLNVSAGIQGPSYLNYQKVPGRLDAFCDWLNEERKNVGNNTIDAYDLSFRAHFRLVSIHPWADGNGRMSRLLMNQLQWEKGLIPTIVFKEHKANYIE
ncbi:MAG: Fic family protein, partial [Bacteroidales bacterium]|nr:Fic family protein [Bacteroidales bacterium]